jgi:cyclopropane fatty-acyl-phospholipid synthase-like methyltransferase
MRPKNIDLPIYSKHNYSDEINFQSFYQGLRMFCPPGTHEAVIKAVLKYLKPGSQVLELGAGVGAFALRLKENGYQVSASGINSESFSVKEIPYFFLNLNESLPSERFKSYDGVVAISVIEHLENVFDFFRKVNYFLKPGGVAFITTPNILDTMSRLLFLHSGNLCMFQKTLVKEWGHIQILPAWLLESAVEKAHLHFLEMYAIIDLMNHVSKMWRKMLVYGFMILKKLFYQEKFSGEFSKITLLMVLKKPDTPFSV